jgi:hypothetical protein
MDSRISATGLIDIEADTVEAQEITVGTNNTIIDETGLQVYHPSPNFGNYSSRGLARHAKCVLIYYWSK